MKPDTARRGRRRTGFQSRRRQVQERADHTPVLLLVHRLAVQVLIKRCRCADRSRLRRQVAHVELPQQVSSVLGLMDKSDLRSLLDLASVEVDGDAECVAVLPVSKSPPPQPKLVSPQVQLV